MKAMAILALIGIGAFAFHPSTVQAKARRSADSRAQCLIEVLASEELPGGAISHNVVRARIRVTPSGSLPFQTTITRSIPWQIAPPRQGQKFLGACPQIEAFGGGY